MIKKIKKIRGKKTNILTSDFRDLIEKELQLDTAYSFMYLFRRFGTPNETNNDDYKILYSYKLEYKDLVFTVHASYNEHVHFTLFIDDKIQEILWKKRKLFLVSLYKEAMKQDIPYVPFNNLLFPTQELTKLQNRNNWKIIDREAKLFFTKKDYAYCDEQFISENPSNDFFDKMDNLGNSLCKKFRKTLSKKQLNDLQAFMPQLKESPEIKKQSIEFINELKKGLMIRDVVINFNGYESDTNQISVVLEESVF